MRTLEKISILPFVKALALASAFALVFSVRADAPAGYYDSAAGLTGGPLKQALHGIISNHRVIPYTELVTPMRAVWRDPANPSNIILTYSQTSVSATSSWNREHIWPRSRGNSDQLGPDDSDLFHVFPTDLSVNAERGSLYFDESDPGDLNYRIPAHSLAPQTSRDSDSWQPTRDERGDIARALFYMDVRYDGQDPQTTDMELVSFPPSGTQMGRLNTLLIWHAQDPPDDAERARNDLIYSVYQNNRNPFIDHPEYVTAIWGNGIPNTLGNRPIARVEVLADAAVEAPSATASFQILLNQFASTGGVPVAFRMSGTALSSEFALSGTGLTYDPATDFWTLVVPENLSSAIVRLTPVDDGVAEGAESVVINLVDDPAYTVVPGETATATILITDGPRLPAAWNFNSGLPYANPLLANSGAGSISFDGWQGTVNSFSGTAGNAIALVGNAGNGSWIDFNLSMRGYADLVLRFWTRGTSSGFNTGTWAASTDGITFTDLPGVNTATTGTLFVQRTVDFSGLAGLTDASNVTLRYTLSGATSANGNNRLDELTATATPIVTGDVPRTVSIVAANAIANEATLDAAVFSVQLNGLAPAGGLSVNLSFASGTATAPGSDGADYVLGGVEDYDPTERTARVFFAEGQRTALVTVTPVSDGLSDHNETVIAEIGASPDYLLSEYISAIARIIEPVVNDAFSAAITLTGNSTRMTGTNVGATSEPNEVRLSSGGRSVWWQWQAPADGVVAIDTRGSNFDTYLGVYTGSAISELSTLGTNDDGGGSLASLLNLRVTAGTIYRIKVEGYSQASGDIVLNLNYAPVPKLTIDAVVPVAKERGVVAGVVRFTLSHSVALPTTVVTGIGGSARFSTDFTTSPATSSQFTIPAGSTSADLRLLPVPDTDMTEQTETIAVFVGSSAHYFRPAAPLNTVTVSLEDDSPYSSGWLSQFPDLVQAPDFALPTADNDVDGVPALLEYISNRNPLVSDGTPLLSLQIERFIDPSDGLEKEFLGIRFLRRLDAVGVPLFLEASSSLQAGSWEQAGVFISATPIEGNVMDELLYRSTLPLTPRAPSVFYRLRATVP